MKQTINQCQNSWGAHEGIILQDLRVCVCVSVYIPVMLSMLKLLPFRDSGSLEILQSCKDTQNNKLTMRINKLKYIHRGYKKIYTHKANYTDTRSNNKSKHTQEHKQSPNTYCMWKRWKHPAVTLNNTVTIRFKAS